MGIFDGVVKLGEKFDKMRQDFLTMSIKFDMLEDSNKKFVFKTESVIEKIKDENENIRRRVTSIVATIDSTLKTSFKEATQFIIREHLDKHGTIIQNPSEIKKILDNNNNNDVDKKE